MYLYNKCRIIIILTFHLQLFFCYGFQKAAPLMKLFSHRGHWERSTSPQSVCHSDRGQSVSPPSGSRHQTVGRSSRSRRAGNHEWSVSPPPQRHVRKQPTSRYLATRSPEAEQWSGGAPLGHRTSTQPQGHYPVSIPGAQPQGSYDIPPPMSANMYPEVGCKSDLLVCPYWLQ